MKNELNALERLNEGRLLKEIADELGMGKTTVKNCFGGTKKSRNTTFHLVNPNVKQ